MALASMATLVKGRGLTFFYDEWAWVMRRRGWSTGVFLEPHNEHLSLLPVTVFKLLFVTVGLSHYGVYRVVGLLFHLTCVTLVFLLVRRRVGDWLGVALASPCSSSEWPGTTCSCRFRSGSSARSRPGWRC